MNARSLPVPRPLSLPDAMAASAPLAALAQRLRASQERFNAVRDALPPGLAAQLRPGPIDDSVWTLLTASPAVAAKLRQLLPVLEQRLHAAGFDARPIRVRVSHGG